MFSIMEPSTTGILQFYSKFTKGIMLYALSAYPFSDFVYEYSSAGRGVIEQELQLSCEMKKR